jgi:hypothetical protein
VPDAGTAACGNGSCGTCGGLGQPCCGSTTYPWCSAPRTTCLGGTSTMLGTCQSCGNAGEPCCTRTSSTVDPCTSGLLCTSSRCLPPT